MPSCLHRPLSPGTAVVLQVTGVRGISVCPAQGQDSQSRDLALVRADMAVKATIVSLTQALGSPYPRVQAAVHLATEAKEITAFLADSRVFGARKVARCT